MQCGSRAAKRVAALPNAAREYIWIGDEILSDSFRRFAEHSHVRQCRHQSNVPGPLESRRRANKRRMGAMASFDMPNEPTMPAWPGWLSRIRSLLRVPITDMDWRWTPPSIKLKEKLPWDTSLAIDVEVPKSLPYKDRITLMTSLESMRELWWTACPLGEEATELSQLSFNRILELSWQRHVRGEVHFLCDVQSFLGSELDIPAAQNLTALLDWYTEKFGSGVLPLKLVKLVTRQIGQFRVSSQEILSILRNFGTHVSQCTGSPSKAISAQLKLYTRAIVPWIRSNEDDVAAKRVAEDLISLITSTAPTMLGAYANRLVVTVSQMPPKLRGEYTGHLTRYMTFCIEAYFNTPPRRDELVSMVDKAIHIAKELQHAPDYQIWWSDMLKNITHDLLSATRDKDVKSKGCLNYWLSVLKNATEDVDKTLLPWWQGILDDITAIVRTRNVDKAPESYAIRSLVLDLGQLQGLKEAYMPPRVALSVLLHVLSKGDTKHAFRIFRKNRAVRLSACHLLPLRMIEAGRTNVSEYKMLLTRPDPDNTVPLEDRVNPHNPLSWRRRFLVEEMARRISFSPDIDDRRAFALVWMLHRYLLDRGVEVSTEMSRALVRAGVTRYLKSNREVAQGRMIRILQSVHKAEGPAVADSLDQLTGSWMSDVRRLHELNPSLKIQQRMAELRGTPSYRLEKNAWIQRRAPEDIGPPRYRWWRRNSKSFRIRGIHRTFLLARKNARGKRAWKAQEWRTKDTQVAEV